MADLVIDHQPIRLADLEHGNRAQIPARNSAGAVVPGAWVEVALKDGQLQMRYVIESAPDRPIIEAGSDFRRTYTELEKTAIERPVCLLHGVRVALTWEPVFQRTGLDETRWVITEAHCPTDPSHDWPETPRELLLARVAERLAPKSTYSSEWAVDQVDGSLAEVVDSVLDTLRIDYGINLGADLNWETGNPPPPAPPPS